MPTLTLQQEQEGERFYFWMWKTEGDSEYWSEDYYDYTDMLMGCYSLEYPGLRADLIDKIINAEPRKGGE